MSWPPYHSLERPPPRLCCSTCEYAVLRCAAFVSPLFPGLHFTLTSQLVAEDEKTGIRTEIGWSVPTNRYTLFQLAHTGPWDWNYFQGALLLRYWVSCPLWNAPEIDSVCVCGRSTHLFLSTNTRKQWGEQLKSSQNLKKKKKGVYWCDLWQEYVVRALLACALACSEWRWLPGMSACIRFNLACSLLWNCACGDWLHRLSPEIYCPIWEKRVHACGVQQQLDFFWQHLWPFFKGVLAICLWVIGHLCINKQVWIRN